MNKLYKQVFMLFLAISLLVPSLPMVASANSTIFASGSGKAEDPYVIMTAEQLNQVRNNLSAHYQLGADIDLSAYASGQGWVPIGSEHNGFVGSFDGNSYTISNLTIDRSANNQGLFGAVGHRDLSNGGEIKNLVLTNVSIKLANSGGALVGTLYNSDVINVRVENGNVSGGSTIGGLIGVSQSSRTKLSYSNANVSGTSSVIGGLVGNLYAYSDKQPPSAIEQSFATGNVHTGRAWAGGLAGWIRNAKIINSYASGEVTAEGDGYNGGYYLGGLAGIITPEYGGTVEIINSHAVGNVENKPKTAGMFADRWWGSSTNLLNSYWNIETTGQDSNILIPRNGRTTAQMADQATFVEWDFNNIWELEDGKDYPTLRGFEPIDRRAKIIPTRPQAGEGTSSNPYIILDANELAYMGDAEGIDKHYKLGADIDLTNFTHEDGNGWMPIGENYYTTFKGSLDGNGKTITGLTINRPDREYVGLFGSTSKTTLINDLTIENAKIIGKNYVGTLVGYTNGDYATVNVNNIFIENTEVHGSNDIGGLIGFSVFSVVNNSYVTGTVSSDNAFIGGLIGRVRGTTVDNTYFVGEVSGNFAVGGLFGYFYDGKLYKSYASANVTGDYPVGGLVGKLEGSQLSDVYAEGSVKASVGYVGGLAGEIHRGKLTNAYANISVIGKEEVGGFAGRSGGLILNSFIVGSVTGKNMVGGFVGKSYTNSIEGSYSDVTIQGESRVGGFAGYHNGYYRLQNNIALGNITATGNYAIGEFVGENNGQGSYYVNSASSVLVNEQFLNGQVYGAATSQPRVLDVEAFHPNDRPETLSLEYIIYPNWNFDTVWYFEAGSKYPKLRATAILNKEDAIPPVTTVEVPEAPASGWYDGDVTLNFAVSEDATTQYRINGGEWMTFTEAVVLGEGNYEVEYRSVDSFGNAEEAKSMSFNIDYTAPTTTPEVTSTVNENGWYTEDVAITLNAVDNVTNAEKIEYRTNGGEWKVYNGPFTLAEGAYSLEYRSVDAAGNVSAIEAKTFNIDTTAPTSNVEMAGTANATGWFTSDVGITLVAEDTVSGANKTEYSTDGVNWITYTDPFTLEDGVYNLQYRSYDAAGYVEAVQTMEINIDQTAPVSEATVAQKANENGWFTDVATLQLGSDDNVSGSAVTEYRITENGTVGEWMTYTEALTLADGVWSVEYRTTDVAGNIEEVNSIDLNVDTTPSVSEGSEMTGAEGANGWYISDVTFAITATDNVSGAATTQYRLNGGKWVTYTAPVTLTEGMYNVEYRTIDVAGNVEVAQAMTINIDTTAPELAVELDQDMLWSPNHKMVDINAALTYADATSHIASVELVSITSNEPDSVNKGDKANDIQLADYGTEDAAFQLRAERLGKGEGRVYTITYKVTDLAGNETTAVAYVNVPHNQGKNKKK